MDLFELRRRLRGTRLLRREGLSSSVARGVYHQLAIASSKRRGLMRTVNGHRLQIRFPYSDVPSNYEASMFATLERCARPGSVVFDVGANWGLFSLVSARLVGGSGHVFAFEPVPGLVSVLRDHLRLNNVADQVSVVPEAVTDRAGTIEVWEQPIDLGNHKRMKVFSGSSLSRNADFITPPLLVTRPATTIDDFCRLNGVMPDIVKVDVEGAEGRVLRGASEFLAAGKGHLLLELHPAMLEEIGDSADDVLELLTAAGWSVQQLASDDWYRTDHYLCSGPATRG